MTSLEQSTQKSLNDSALDTNQREFTEHEASKPEKFQNSGTILGKTGGAYIPPARLAMMQKEISDKSSDAYQRVSWEALKKSLNGLINKVLLC